MKTLYELGLTYDTDKSTYHLFTIIYDYVFSKVRNNNMEILEIGIHNGSSIKMWEEYFTNSKIYGADILDRSQFDVGRIKTFIVNQELESDLEKLPKGLDIIIDDGGHTMLQQQLTLKKLFTSNLKSSGVYIIEDLHTSEPRYYHSHGSNESNNTINLLEDLIRGEMRENSDYYLNESDFYKIKNDIISIDIIRLKDDSITSVIYKK